MGHACCRPPQLPSSRLAALACYAVAGRFVGLHFTFLSYTQSYATTWLHSGLLYFRPAFAGLLCSAGVRPRGGEGGFSLGWATNGCMGTMFRHALCHPSGVRICFFCGGSRGLGLRVCAFYAHTGRPLRGSRLRCGAAPPRQVATPPPGYCIAPLRGS